MSYCEKQQDTLKTWLSKLMDKITPRDMQCRQVKKNTNFTK